MDLTSLSQAQDQLMTDLAASVSAFLEANPEVTIQGVYFDQADIEGTNVKFRSTMTFTDEQATVSRTV
jgi:hypothetical protein